MRRQQHWLAAGLVLAGAASVTAQDMTVQDYRELPFRQFGDGGSLGKYNYIGKIPIGMIDEDGRFLDEQAMHPDSGVGSTADMIKLQKELGFQPGDGVVAAPVSVAADEFRLNNPQGQTLGIRLTVAGVASVVTIAAAGSYSGKLAAGQTAMVEISSGLTVTTTSLQPGGAYAILVVNGTYVIVPAY